MSNLKTICSIALLIASAATARAEVSEITVAQQYGVSFLPLMVMERNALVEKHAQAAGLSGLKVNWAKVAGPSVMNDGLISGSIHYAAQDNQGLRPEGQDRRALDQDLDAGDHDPDGGCRRVRREGLRQARRAHDLPVASRRAAGADQQHSRRECPFHLLPVL